MQAIGAPTKTQIPELLIDLKVAGVLSDFQYSELCARWPALDKDWEHHPWFRAIPEHSRAMINGVFITST